MTACMSHATHSHHACCHVTPCPSQPCREECKAQVNGYPAARYKSFHTVEEAQEFVTGSKGPIPGPGPAALSQQAPMQRHATIGVAIAVPSQAPRSSQAAPYSSAGYSKPTTQQPAYHSNGSSQQSSRYQTSEDQAWSHMAAARQGAGGGPSTQGHAGTSSRHSNDGSGPAAYGGATLQGGAGGNSVVDRAASIAAGAESTGYQAELLEGSGPIEPQAPYFMVRRLVIVKTARKHVQGTCMPPSSPVPLPSLQLGEYGVRVCTAEL